MSKINLNSRLWKNSAGGRLELIDLKVDQSVVIGADVVFNDINATGDVIIEGDLTVQGTTTSLSTDVIEMQDNIILINAEETGVGVTPNLSGLEVERGTLTNQRIVFQESNDTWRIGEVGDTQAIATREDAPLINGIMTWNDIERRLDSVNDILIDIKFSGSNATNINTGAIHTTGGIGVTQDIHIGGAIYLLGTTPNNSSIDSDAGNNLVLTSVEDISLVPNAGKDINIPTNIGLTFAGDLYKIESNGIDLSLNSNGDINLTPADNINIPDNKLLTFGSDLRNISSNGSDLCINSDGEIKLDTTDTVNGISIGTANAGVPISIGNTVSETTINDNLTVLGSLGLLGTTTFQADVIIDVDHLKAFNIRKDGDSGDVLTIDTINAYALLQNPDAPTNSNVLYLYNPSKDTGNTVSMFWDLDESTDTRTSYAELQTEIKTNTTTAEDGALHIKVSSNGSLDTYMTFDGDLGLIQSEVPNVIDNTSTEAFLVRKDSDSGDIFAVDSTNNEIVIGNSTTVSDIRFYGSNTSLQRIYFNDGSDAAYFEYSHTDDTFNLNEKTHIDATATEAFLVRKASDSGDVLTVNTTNAYTLLQNPDAPTNSNVLYLYNPSKDTGNTVSMFWELDESTNARTSYAELQTEIKTNTTTAEDGALHIKVSSNGSLDTYMTFDGDLGLIQSEVPNVIDNTSTEAFLVRKDSDSGDQFIVDTTNNRTVAINTFRIGAANDGIDFLFDGIDTLDISAVNTNDKININNSISVLEIVNDLDVDGHTFLDQTTILTNDGTFQISGANGFDCDVGDTSRLVTSSGNITIDAEAGNLILDGASAATLDSTGSISIDAGAASNFTTSSGILTLDGGSGINFEGNASEIDFNTTGPIDINSGGLLSIDTTSTGLGITIGTSTSGVPISIGHTVSETTINDNLTVIGTISLEECLIIDATKSEAILVRKNGDAGDVFIVDTMNSRIGINKTPTTSLDILGDSLFDGKVTIDHTDTEAFLVRKNSDGGDIFAVDSANNEIAIGNSTTVSDIRFYGSNTSLQRTYFNDGSDAAYFEYSHADDTFSMYLGGETKFLLGTSSYTLNEQVTIDSTSTEALLVRKNSDSGDIFTVNTTSDIVTTNSANLRIQGDITGTPSSTGAYLTYITSTFTDDNTAVSGTAAVANFNSFGASVLAASNASVTTTTAATVYIEGAPTAGTNQTITNSYALWVDSGSVKIDNSLIVANTTTDTLIVDTTATEAVVVRKDSDSGDVFTIDTTNEIVTNDAKVIIDHTDTEAFLVRKDSDSGDVFTIDTTNESIIIDSSFTEAFLVRKNSDSGDMFTIDTTNETVTNDAKVVIDRTDTEALLIRKGSDSGDIFNVDTSGDIVTINAGTHISHDLRLGSSVSGTPGATGPYLNILGSTFTDNDTAASGTAALMNFHTIAAPTLAATNSSVTTALATTLYIAGAPIVGTNETITEKYALYVASADNVRFTGDLFVDGSITATGTLTDTITLDYNSIDTLLIRKDGDAGDVFRVDTINEKTVFSKDTNGVGDKVKTEYNLFNSSNVQTVFGTIEVELDTATAGSESGSMYLSAVNSGSIKDYVIINGGSDSVDILSNVNLTFADPGENIVGDGTALTLNSSEDIYLSATTNVNIPANVNLTFGDDGENIVGDGTDLTINSSNKFNIIGVTLDADISGSTDITSGANSNFTTTAGNITIDSEAGNLNLDGNNQVNIDSAGGVSIDAAGASNFTTTSGILTLDGIGVAIEGNTGVVSIDTSNTGTGIAIGTANTGIPITIGHTVSETVVADNLTVNGNFTVGGTTTTLDTETLVVEDNLILTNSAPSGISDAGVLGKRYQPQNDSSLGEVVADNAEETGTAQAGAATTITLAAGANGSDDYYNGWWIKLTGGTGSGQCRQIKDYNGTTKVATIYDTADETGDAQTPPRGADFTTNPDATSVYSLHGGTYAGTFFDESLDEWAICYTADSPGAGSANIIKYVDLHVNSLLTETALGVTGLLIDHNNTEAVLIRKDGDSGDVFQVDTINSEVSIPGGLLSMNNATSNLINFESNGAAAPTLTTRSAGTKIVLYDALSGSNVDYAIGVDTFTLWSSVPQGNSTHLFKWYGGTTELMRLQGDGLLTLQGNQIIDNTSSEALLVRKNADSGDVFVVDTTNSSVQINSPVDGSVPLSIGYNAGTTQIFLERNGGGGGLSMYVDSNKDAWITNGSGASDLNFQTNSFGQIYFRPSGTLTLTVNSDTIYSQTKNFIETTDTEAFLVRKDGDTGDVFKIDTSNDTIGIEARVSIFGNKSGTPSDAGTYLRCNNGTNTFTDNNTAGSGTAAIMSFNSFGTPTLAATNTSVTTTDAATVYIKGAPIAGTNQTITNSYALWVDSGKVKIDGDLEIDGDIIGNVSSPSITISSSNLVNVAAAGNVTVQYAKLVKNGPTNRSLWISFDITPTSGGLKTSFRFTVPQLTTITNKYDITGTNQGYLDSDDTNIENGVVVAVPADDNCKVQFTSIDNTTHSVQVQINYESN